MRTHTHNTTTFRRHALVLTAMATWGCPACSYENEPRAAKCEMCLQLRAAFRPQTSVPERKIATLPPTPPCQILAHGVVLFKRHVSEADQQAILQKVFEWRRIHPPPKNQQEQLKTKLSKAQQSRDMALFPSNLAVYPDPQTSAKPTELLTVGKTLMQHARGTAAGLSRLVSAQGLAVLAYPVGGKFELHRDAAPGLMHVRSCWRVCVRLHLRWMA